LHWHDEEQAHAIIRGSERTLSDPWLLAAEVAVASSRDRKSRNIRHAKSMLSDANNSPASLSELAAAVGNHEKKHGSVRKAAGLFTQALVDPTENTVAQVRWEEANDADLVVEGDDPEDVPRLYEARAREALDTGFWSDAVENCDLWYKDQPFSSGPSTLGAHMLYLMGRDEEAAEMAVRAKDANPGEPSVLNASLYYQLLSDNLPAARETAVELEHLKERYTPIERLVIWATTGLLQYREGFPEIGRLLYEQAIKSATHHNRPDLTAGAYANLAREEILQGNFDYAVDALSEAKTAAARLRYPKANEAEIRRVEQLLGGTPAKR
jgi:tetratricopeptide (TPR) repeat protein